MGRKGILINDPLVSQMNPTQWVWEAESVIIAEEDRVEELKAIFKVVKATTIRLLGLNINPIEEEDGRLRTPGDNEIIPLSIWCGSETILKDVLERNKQMADQDKVEADIEAGVGNPTSKLSVDEFDALMDNMDAQGDIDFDDDTDLFSNPEWTSEDARAMRSQLIETLDVPGINKKAKVTIEEIDDDDMPELMNPMKVVIESLEEE